MNLTKNKIGQIDWIIWNSQSHVDVYDFLTNFGGYIIFIWIEYTIGVYWS